MAEAGSGAKTLPPRRGPVRNRRLESTVAVEMRSPRRRSAHLKRRAAESNPGNGADKTAPGVGGTTRAGGLRRGSAISGRRWKRRWAMEGESLASRACFVASPGRYIAFFDPHCEVGQRASLRAKPFSPRLTRPHSICPTYRPPTRASASTLSRTAWLRSMLINSHLTRRSAAT